MEQGVVKANGQTLAYEIAGDGPPLLLIMGFGLPGAAAAGLVATLSEHYRVITFDNRGIGASESTGESYEIADMADDAAALLDALDISRAHVAGQSMGGYIAQELALRHPDRIDRLVLISTTCNVARYRGVTFATVWPVLFRHHPDLFGAELAQWAFTRELIADEEAFAQMTEAVGELVGDLDPDEYDRQAAAINRFDASNRLDEIEAPALVIVGDRDKLTTPDDARELVDGIPNAELCTIPRAAHAAVVVRADEVSEAMHEFLSR